MSFRSIFLFSSVVYVQYTPSSKRNLSSKIHHKSLPTYFLTLTKKILANISIYERIIISFLSMLPDMPYAGIPVPACLKVVVFRFLVAITYE